MQSTHFTVFDTGQRVRGFLDAQTAAIGTAVPPTLRAQLDDGITQVAAFQLEQGTSAGAAHGETTKQQALRDDLWVRFLSPIAGIARKKFRDTTEFPALVVSSALRRTNRIAAKAAECADAAAKDEKTFVDNGLPADFVAQMRAAIASITDSVTTRGRQLSRKAAATEGLKAGDKSIRETIDTLNRAITPALKGKAALMADWMASKRIRQPVVAPLPTGSVGTSAATATPPASASTPAPVVPASTQAAA